MPNVRMLLKSLLIYWRPDAAMRERERKQFVSREIDGIDIALIYLPRIAAFICAHRHFLPRGYGATWKGTGQVGGD